MSKYLSALLVLLFALSFLLVDGGPKKEARPRSVSSFELKDARDQKTVSLAGLRDSEAIVVVFLGTQCTINNAFLPELARLQKQYARCGGRFDGDHADE